MCFNIYWTNIKLHKLCTGILLISPRNFGNWNLRIDTGRQWVLVFSPHSLSIWFLSVWCSLMSLGCLDWINYFEFECYKIYIVMYYPSAIQWVWLLFRAMVSCLIVKYFMPEMVIKHTIVVNNNKCSLFMYLKKTKIYNIIQFNIDT